MADIGMAAFSAFFMQSPSFLAHQRRFEAGHGRSNAASLFGIAKLPSDKHIRDMLDPAAPALVHPLFSAAVDRLARIDGGLDAFRRLDGRLLIALDGTEYHCSRKIRCAQCSTRLRGKTDKAGKGETECFHTMLAATLVAPGHDRVIPLQPEFIVPQDGAQKQDCENAAAKRWLAAHGPRYAALGAVFLGDDRFSRQPLCQGGAGCRRAVHLRLQARLPSADRGVSARGRAAHHRTDGPARQAAVRPPLSLVARHPTARRQRCAAGQLVADRDPRAGRPDHVSQQLRHQPAGRAG
jgi:hypothetical protein